MQISSDPKSEKQPSKEVSDGMATRPQLSLVQIASSISVASAIITGLAYGFGYIALRSRLLALGISPELGLVEERYLSVGFTFILYSVALLPTIVVVLGCMIAVLQIGRSLANRFEYTKSLSHHLANPVVSLTFAYLLSLLAIHFALGDVFLLNDLILSRPVLKSHQLAIYADPTENLLSAFVAVALLCIFFCSILLYRCSRVAGSEIWKLAYFGLFALVTCQCGLVVANWGALSAGRYAERLDLALSSPIATSNRPNSLAGIGPSAPCSIIWRVWKDSRTSVLVETIATGLGTASSRILYVETQNIESPLVVSGHDNIINLMYININEPVCK